ncbi:MAG: hypothetical protein JWR37_3782 [Mycobacterium sp.]|nr:hypothetical protein [Mycobacterium sp.]
MVQSGAPWRPGPRVVVADSQQEPRRSHRGVSPQDVAADPGDRPYPQSLN